MYWLADVFFFQAEDGIRDLVRSRGLGDVYKRQILARSMIGQHHLDVLEIGAELALLDQLAQPLEDVPGAHLELLSRGVLHIQQFGRLFFEGQRAAGAGAHDRNALRGIIGQVAHVALVQAARGAKLAVAEHRQTAAILRRHDDLVAMMLKNQDGRLANERLVIQGGAAVLVDHLLAVSYTPPTPPTSDPV